MSRPIVRAGGGVLWRADVADPEVALVHRPQYDDWSLPKGKAKPDEPLLLTAIREMREETGHRPHIGPFLTTVRYRVTSGGRSAHKEVSYWSMRSTGGEFAASREVDELRWLPLAEARSCVTSASDRVVLDAFAATPRDTSPLLLVRHAATAAPARRVRSARLEPRLNRSGRGQAAALVPVLASIGVADLICADVPACVDTLAPFAAAAGLPVRRDVALTRDGFSGNEEQVAEQVLGTAAAGGPLVVCSPQRVISGLLAMLGRGSGARPPQDTSVKKGGWWLLHRHDAAIRAYERHEPAA